MDAAGIRNATARGRCVFGYMLTSPSPHWPRKIQATGAECVFIDTEHIATDRVTLAWMCQTFAALNLAPIVRISHPNPHLAREVLDGGAAGVVAPYIEDPEEARALVGAVKFRPLKGAKLERIQSGREKPPAAMRRYLERYSRGALVLVNIESAPALERLDEILDVPGLDGLLIGPHDLSCSLDVPEQYGHRRYKAAVTKIIRAARKRKLIAGIHFMDCGSNADAARWIRAGINLHFHHADIVFAMRGFEQDLAKLRGKPKRGHARKIIV